MSLTDNLNTTQRVTRWRLTEGSRRDPYSSEYALPLTYDCDFKNENKTVRADDGTEFIPKSAFLVNGPNDIIKGDRVILGESQLAQPPKGVEEVKQIITANPIRGIQKYLIYTG